MSALLLLLSLPNATAAAQDRTIPPGHGGVPGPIPVPGTPSAAEPDAEPEPEPPAESDRRVIGSHTETEGDESLLDDLEDGSEILERRARERHERNVAAVAERYGSRTPYDRQLARSAGWTLMHPSTESRVALWFTHGNDDVARFFHDFHLLAQVGFRYNEWEFAFFTMWGVRAQATSRDTGLDALWLGGKLQLPFARGDAGVLAVGGALGLPSNRQVGGEPRVFADHANTLIFVDDVTLDFAVYATLFLGEMAGMNAHVSLQLPLGMRRSAGINIALEFYSRLGEPSAERFDPNWDGWASDLRGGLQVSTLFTPLVAYVESGLVYESLVRFAFRAAVTIGTSVNIGNVTDVQLLFVFEWRFGEMLRE